MSQFNYIPADEIIIFNDGDPDLKPIEYRLPPPPPFQNTLGYGLDPKDQKWERFTMPRKLKDLNNDTDLTPKQKELVLQGKQAYYTEEIEFVKQDRQYFIEGLWVFIKGKQVWIPPAFYFWLQWWTIEGKHVDFRIRDWEFWVWDYMVDYDSYCYGTNYPKGRREGCTHKRMCKRYKVAISFSYALCGMQSKDRKHAKEVHEQYLVPVWKDHMPFWWKPIHNDQTNDLSSIKFSAPTSRSHPDYGQKSLHSTIDYRDSGETAYDGLKLIDIFNDEAGKLTECSIHDRWMVQRLTLTNHTHAMPDGSKRKGKGFNGSTVAEMLKKGGQNFKLLCDESHYHNRNETTGRTTSWLYNFFMPSSEGFGDDMPLNLQQKYGVKAWIDDYGYDNLDPETGRPLAEKFMLAQRREYELSGNIEALIEFTRMYPLRWRDCWKQNATDCNFNLAILDSRIEEFAEGNPFKQRGNFEWRDNVKDGHVVWIPDPNGRWFLSFQLDPQESNSYYMDHGMRVPGNTKRFCAGGDPFKYKITKSSKKSKGAGAVFMKHDFKVDPPTKDVNDYKTNRFCCTYSNRPKDLKAYGEDMIMMCVYFGCTMNPEINVTFLWDWFEERGYGRYLYYSYDEHKNKISSQPGVTTSEKTKEEIFREYAYHIQHYGHLEVHDELLQECKDIEDDMGDYDLFAAGGLALLSNDKNKYVPQEQKKEDIQELFPTYYYNN